MSSKKLTREDIMKALEKHSDILRKYTVKKIGLFGSYSVDKQTINSDIDFLVELEEPTFDNFMDLVFFLEDLFNKKVDLITKGSLSPYIQLYVEEELRWHEV